MSKLDLPDGQTFPLKLKTIHKLQKLDDEILAKAQKGLYSVHNFRGGGESIPLLVEKAKIVVPKVLHERVVEWYHINLCHPGRTRTELTIRQHFTWSNLRDTVENVCRKCQICQRTKRTTKKWGLLPPKEAEANPWEKLCVDTIGPYEIDHIS